MPPPPISWDDWCMEIAETYAKKSKDESTKLGAVIMAPAPGRQLLSAGYNSFPRGIVDTVPKRQLRPEKYKWFVHAEANAVYNAARTGVSLLEGILYCRWLPCHICAMAIIQSGVSEIVVSSFSVPERWRGDMGIAIQMLMEASVYIRLSNEGWTDWSRIKEVLNG